ncbi:MAG: serine hydrolase [Phenylobacterium sp.]|nr:serine hydrolase [Phenylobacterium sp.]
MSGYISRRGLLLTGAGAGLATALPTASWARAGRDALDGFDVTANAFLAAFGTPGVGIGVVRPGQPDFMRGYGVRTLGQPTLIGADTLFAVASNSKAMTAAGLAVLVDQGKLGWDDLVTKHLPEFAMYDPETTRLMTVRDLLTHRSGLPLGAGDLMIWPGTTHTRAEVLHGLRYLKPVRGFRVGYDYDNVLYVVAGILIERLSGKSWEDYITQTILRPCGMATAVPAPTMVANSDQAGRHARLGGPIYGIGEMTVVPRQETDSFAPAGGVQASVRDMLSWLKVQLARGKAADGRPVFSEAQARAMWAPQTLIRTSDGPTPDQPGLALADTYSLGWRVFDYRGERVIGHSGAMNGQITYTAMIPARGMALTVLTNAEEGAVLNGLRNVLLDRLMGKSFDWLDYWKTKDRKDKQDALDTLRQAETSRPAGGPTQPLDRYVGTYADPWYGPIEVSRRGEGLHLRMVKTPAFAGPLEVWGPDVFVARFADPKVEVPIVTFHMEGGRVARITMKALSPLADFSYDFHHLDFTPVS